MSEEKNLETNAEQKCSCNCIKNLVIVTLLVSLCTLGLLIYSLFGGKNVVAPSKGHDHAQADSGAKVVVSTQYDKGQSLEKAEKTKKPIIVFFYTDWCGYCQRFAPTFHEVSKLGEIKKNFAIAYVNCEDTNNEALMNKYEIKGFPTVFVIDEKGNKTRIDNRLLFEGEPVTTIKTKALEAIGK